MTPRSNAHTHSTWCDGKNTPEEVIQAALALGFHSLGFTSHAPAPFDPGCPGVPNEEAYVCDIRRLRDKYAGQISISCALEQDTYAPAGRTDYDYIIGSHHYLKSKIGGQLFAVDDGAEILRGYIHTCHNGNAYAMARQFYEDTAQSVRRFKPDIVGHYDLIKKYNKDGSVFDEEDPAYQSAALESFDDVLDTLEGYGGMVEVNTGGMARGWHTMPYVAPFLLRHAAGRKARLIITSDSHSADTVAAYFEEAAALLQHCGAKSVAVLRDGRFVDEKL